MKKAKWWRLPPSFGISKGEYEANLQGMNILFGAVLGFVLAGTNEVAPLDFVLILLLSATTVVLILYLAHSDYKLFYLVMTGGAIFALPAVLTDILEVPEIPQLQPTLGVWALMVLIVELMPRERGTQAKENSQ